MAGTIPATKLSANTTAGFSIVTYEGTGSTGTIAHGLSAAPEFLIVHILTASASAAADNWVVYHIGAHASAPEQYYLRLDTPDLPSDDTIWADDKPDATTFNVYNGYTKVNDDGSTYVAYCFTPIEGFSKFGSFVSNGVINGSFCYTGFKPALVIIKKVTAATQSWIMKDGTRNPHNPATRSLYANLTNAESPDTADNDNDIDLLSNGFKIRNSGHTGSNSSGETYIYCAFAETPFGGDGVAQGKAR